MLPTIDSEYLANQVSNFKKTYFQHVMDYGPSQHVNFMLPFSEIKQATGRARITNNIVSLYESYLKLHGLQVLPNELGLMVTVNPKTLVLFGNESIAYNNARDAFRAKSMINGDVDGM